MNQSGPSAAVDRCGALSLLIVPTNRPRNYLLEAPWKETLADRAWKR